MAHGRKPPASPPTHPPATPDGGGAQPLRAAQSHAARGDAQRPRPAPLGVPCPPVAPRVPALCPGAPTASSPPLVYSTALLMWGLRRRVGRLLTACAAVWDGCSRLLCAEAGCCGHSPGAAAAAARSALQQVET
uniref:Uncharacterized protein n=1 Tax=Oryza nivara TaxID=4536 RepID=A0A0E0FZQ2_ORYNI